MTSAGTLPRPRRRWVWVLVALATAAAFAVPFRLQLVPKGGLQHGVDSPVVYRRDISDLQVLASGGTAVAIRAGRPGQVTVSTSLSWGFRKPAVSQVWHGGTFWLGATCPEPDPFGRCQVSTVISVPAGTAVRAQAGAGTVTVADLSGPLHLSATSGLLMARDVSGPVWATVTSGTVLARSNLTSPHFYVSATSGHIALAFAGPPRTVAVGLGAGSAEITVPVGSRYRIVRSLGSGVLAVAPGLSDVGSDLVLMATVGSGAATIGYPAGAG